VAYPVSAASVIAAPVVPFARATTLFTVFVGAAAAKEASRAPAERTENFMMNVFLQSIWNRE
jgi:hypothetical protein